VNLAATAEERKDKQLRDEITKLKSAIYDVIVDARARQTHRGTDVPAGRVSRASYYWHG
jgi:hypothetical protein